MVEPTPAPAPRPSLAKFKSQFDTKWLENKPGLGKLSDYQLNRTIGQGKFGRVMLAHVLKSNQVVAIKILRKSDILRLKQLKHVIQEKKILQSARYPFLVSYLTHFKNNGHLFFVLEFVAGGDLFTMIKRYGRLNEYECSFFSAQIVLAFEYLHYVGVIFRDLKTENVLMDYKGYLKITDFGFAKKVDQSTTSTLCGTPEYFAPELIRQVPYSYELDWWTLGILMYELLEGHTPFRHKDYKTMFKDILKGNVNYPSYFNSDTLDIIKQLLKINPNDRLATAPEVISHRYFRKIQWDALYWKQIDAPFQPSVKKQSDVSNFDTNHIKEEELEEHDDDIYPEEFKDFSNMLSFFTNLVRKVLKKFKSFFGYHEEPEDKRQRIELQSQKIETFLQQSKTTFQEKWKKNEKSNVTMSDFILVRTLGEGKFGRVMLIRDKRSEIPTYLALKVMNKRTILLRCTVACVLFEKRILQSCQHPFVVQYKHHFKDNANLYLVLEYVGGGDLYVHIRRSIRFNDALVRFYAAQLILALEYLHYMGVVHRDLKPENIMVGENGYLKVTDFGFSKYIGNGLTSTKCGTRAYMAPEILSFKRIFYSFNVDWWPIGVLIYEMSVGRIPFEASNNLELLYRIKKHDIRYPSYLKKCTKEIVQKLLTYKIASRLVLAKDIKMHSYFEEINWVALFERKVEPPFVPTVRSSMDTSNFEHFQEERIEEWQEDIYEEEFKDF
ncbi:uncharacterized protein LOC135846780 [Planococcus citri]|uniref:uncharacterized protein LOC135846780 n=1 Tax=Planococcus citri TaxID=170843 RepID=UPI0031F88540